MPTNLRVSGLIILGILLLAACGRTEPPKPTAELTVVLAGTGTGSVTSDPSGIDTGASTLVATFDEGTEVTLIAAAAVGSSFAGWTGACEGTNLTCTFELDADATVTATFTLDPVVPDTAELTVVLAGTGSGAVTSDPTGIDTGASAFVATFDEGTEITLTAVPASGSTFVGWTGACEGTALTCTFELDADATVTATFDLTTADLTVSVVTAGGAEGSVTSDPAGIDTADGVDTFTFVVGTEVTLTATVDEGGFAGWTDGPCDGITALTCTLTIVEGQEGVAANFNAVVTASFPVLAGTDDAEEFLADSTNSGNINDRWPEGHTYTFSNDLELGFDPSHAPQAIGIRFANVTVPAGANVLTASIGFTAFTNPTTGGTGSLPLVITAQDAANTSTFVGDPNPPVGPNPGSFGVTSLPRTAASVAWTITATWVADTQYASSDLASIVREVIGLGGWSSGNAMTFIVEPVDPGTVDATNFRRAYAFDAGVPANVPVLNVQYVPLP